MSLRSIFICLSAALVLAGCAHRPMMHPGESLAHADPAPDFVSAAGTALRSWSQRPAVVLHGEPGLKDGWDIVGEDASIVEIMQETDHGGWSGGTVVEASFKDGSAGSASKRYLLDSGDKLRVFVYGQPNLSRIYTVDHSGMISVPLIGEVRARNMTTYGVASVIGDLLERDFVRDPQVTVDLHEARPFFILGEVRNAGQYPFVAGLTIERAIAIAGGYTERANMRVFRVSRPLSGGAKEDVEAGADYALQPGDTLFVHERFF